MPVKTAEPRASRAWKQSRRFLKEASALGVMVRMLRTGQKLTLEAAAEKMELDLKHLQKVEAGVLNPTLVTLVRIASGLGVTVATLFGGAAKRKKAARP